MRADTEYLRNHPGRRPAGLRKRSPPWRSACLILLAAGMIISAVSAAATLNASPPASPVKLIFVHHSTGEAWLADDHGGLGTALRDNRYFVSDTNYGWGPGSIGDRTDIGNWWEWFRGPSNGTILAALYAESGQHSSYSRLGSDPGGENQIILFKSCFPNSALGGTPGAGVPPIGLNPLKGESCGSGYHTVANAKGIYNDLLPYFASHPEKLFVVITAPPLSDATYAANARAFNEWLVHDWLTGYTGENVAVFDYYTVLTTNNGTVNKNDLGALTGNHHRFRAGVIEHTGTGDNDANPNISEYASSPGDDHPSKAGDQKATGEFLPLLNIAYNRWLASQGTGTGAISVLSSPGGASVSIDGTARGTTGESPLVITGLSAGSHTVVVHLAGYADQATTATVNAGQTTALLPRLTPSGPGCPVFPADHIWNVPVDTLPVDPQSAAYVATIGTTGYLHPDFGSGTWEGFPIGIPYVTVPGTQPKVPVTFDQYGDESDPGPYPIPANPPIEGDPAGSADRHMLIVDRDNQRLYELYAAHKEADGWYAGSGAVFDLAGYGLRQETWTSADAAGLAILPGLVRYEEVAAGEINHAIRFTAPQTRKAYVWPARHYASSLTGSQYPPMGQRFRLKADFDISGYAPRVQVILTALKRYGMVLADNGAPWYIGGVPDERWDNDELHVLQTVPGSAFEAVDISSLLISPDSGQARTAAPDTTPPRSVTGLKNTTYATSYIRWTWTDPADADFAKVMVFLDGTFRANETKGTRAFNATGLSQNTQHTIGTRTVDAAGNINATWVNHTARTTSAAGNTYYVAPGGNNTNPGTTALPWATPGYGSRQLSPGDTLVIRGGTYSLQVFDQDIIMPPPGEPDGWIVIRGEEGNRPVLKGSGNLYSSIILSGSRYLRIENLEITSDAGQPFRGGIVGVDGVLQHVVFEDLYIHHIDEYAVDIRDCEDLIIGNCSFLYCGFGAIGGPEALAGGWQDAVIRSCNLSYSGHYYQGTPGPGPYDRPDGFGIEPSAGPVTITQTVASHNRGDGLDSKAGNTTIERCIVANNACDGVKLWGDGSRVENTLIYGTGDGTGGASPWAGIVIGADSPPNARFSLINVAVHDNPTRQAYPMYVQYGSSNPISLIMRNMIIANGYGLVSIGDSVTLSADHCLFYRPGSDEQVYANGRTYSRADIAAGLLGEGNRWGDPLFTSPAWGSDGDYHLLAGSPAIDAGSATGAPVTDLGGVSRPQGAGYDMGPYEYRNGSTPPDTTPPRSVTALKNTTYAASYIAWTWTDPADADFARVMVFLDGVYKGDIPKGTRAYNATGLSQNTQHTVATRTIDTAGNINQTWVNHTARTKPTGDTTPPRSVTSLKNTTYAAGYIRWTWTAPADADFAKVMVFLDGVYKGDIPKGTRAYNATGLEPGSRHTIGTRTVDKSGNINQTWVNHTATTKPAGDTLPPRGITNLKNTTATTSSIRWTWTDPPDTDFSRVKVYLNGVYKKDVTRGTRYYLASGLAANTQYTIGTRTVDRSGNINLTWVNHTATTKARSW